MPGIAGIISRQPAAESARLVAAMVATMRLENFYSTGSFAAPEVCVCAGWLAHENSFADKQVFQSEQKDISLVFSGECFPDVATKHRLRINGHVSAEKYRPSEIQDRPVRVARCRGRQG